MAAVNNTVSPCMCTIFCNHTLFYILDRVMRCILLAYYARSFSAGGFICQLSLTTYTSKGLERDIHDGRKSLMSHTKWGNSYYWCLDQSIAIIHCLKKANCEKWMATLSIVFACCSTGLFLCSFRYAFECVGIG